MINEVKHYLGTGAPADYLDGFVRSAFIAQRDAAITRLVAEIAALRSGTVESSMDELTLRAELNTMDEVSVNSFTDRFSGLLARLCEPEHLFEMTSFSLPEGRDAASLDHWSFVAFDGDRGELVPKPIQVLSRDVSGPPEPAVWFHLADTLL